MTTTTADQVTTPAKPQRKARTRAAAPTADQLAEAERRVADAQTAEEQARAAVVAEREALEELRGRERRQALEALITRITSSGHAARVHAAVEAVAAAQAALCQAHAELAADLRAWAGEARELGVRQSAAGAEVPASDLGLAWRPENAGYVLRVGARKYAAPSLGILTDSALVIGTRAAGQEPPRWGIGGTAARDLVADPGTWLTERC